MIPEITTAHKGQAGGLALVQKYGQEHMKDISRMGGRPRALSVGNINRNMASAAQKEKEERHGKGLKELLRLWKERQACFAVVEQACLPKGVAGCWHSQPGNQGGEGHPRFLPVPCGALTVIGDPGNPSSQIKESTNEPS